MKRVLIILCLLAGAVLLGRYVLASLEPGFRFYPSTGASEAVLLPQGQGGFECKKAGEYKVYFESFDVPKRPEADSSEQEKHQYKDRLGTYPGWAQRAMVCEIKSESGSTPVQFKPFSSAGKEEFCLDREIATVPLGTFEVEKPGEYQLSSHSQYSDFPYDWAIVIVPEGWSYDAAKHSYVSGHLQRQGPM